jgi:hypothetical protein
VAQEVLLHRLVATLSILLPRQALTTLEVSKRSVNSICSDSVAACGIDCNDSIDSLGNRSVDNQQIFNIVVSVAAFLAVYVFNNMTRQIQKLEDKVNDLPHSYVQKDDYRADIAEIKSILKQIFEKLDSKADK